jgi:hypothetical protein
MADHDQLVAGLLGVTGELAHRLDAPAPARAARCSRDAGSTC